MLKIMSRLTLFLLLAQPLMAWSQPTEHKITKSLQLKLAHTKAEQIVPVFIYFKDKGRQISQKLELAERNLNTNARKRRGKNSFDGQLVSYKDIPVNDSYLQQIMPLLTKVRHRLKILNAVSAELPARAIAEIEKMQFVAKIALINRLKRKPAPTGKTTDKFTLARNVSEKSNRPTYNYGASLTQNEQMQVPAVHDLGYTGNGVVIAILDAGFNRLSHEAFSSMNIAGQWDFVNNDGDVSDGTDMGTGSHGTNTLSAVGGFSDGNLIGPAFAATFYLAKTENTESELHVEEDNWCAAAQWADDNGADIITSSLGYTDFDTGTNYTPSDMDGDTTVISQCADAVADNGILVINSAGNSGAGNGENTLGAPSDGQSVLAIGAVTSNETRSSFSSVGPSADGRIKPDVMAMGSAVRLASSLSDTGYINADGTSFSCPLVAGVAALILEANPNLSAAEARDILRNTADRADIPDNSYGYGIVNALAAVAVATGKSAPAAGFSFSVTNESVTFTDSSTDTDGTISGYSWEFGDGQTSTEQNPAHDYAALGDYSVRLTVTDNDGIEGHSTQTVSITSISSSTGGNNNNGGSSSSGGGGSISLWCALLILLGGPGRKFYSRPLRFTSK